MSDIEKILRQLRSGQNAMPAFYRSFSLRAIIEEVHQERLSLIRQHADRLLRNEG